MCRVQDPFHSGQGHTDHFSVFRFRFLTSKLVNRFSNNCIYLLNILRRCVICKNHALKFKVKVVPEGHSFFISTPYLQHAPMNCKTIIHRVFVAMSRWCVMRKTHILWVKVALGSPRPSVWKILFSYIVHTIYAINLIFQKNDQQRDRAFHEQSSRTYSQGQGHRWPSKVAVEKSVKFQWFNEFLNHHINWVTIIWQCAICKIYAPLMKVKVM